MRKTIASIVVLIGIASCAIAQPYGTESGFRFHDQRTQQYFVEELEREHIPFRLSSDGAVLYAPGDEERVSRIRMAVLRETFKPSVRIPNPDLESKFIAALRSERIEFSIEERNGERWISWSKNDDERVEQIRRATLGLQ